MPAHAYGVEPRDYLHEGSTTSNGRPASNRPAASSHQPIPARQPVRTGSSAMGAATKSGKKRGRKRRSPRTRLVLRVIAALLTVVLVWLAFSIGGALTAPGTDTTAARLAEWARTHHLGWVVTKAEQAQYQMNKPKVGGSVKGGIPTVGASDKPSEGQQQLNVPTSNAPGVVPPIDTPALKNEGQWQTIYQVGGHPAGRVTYLRPDAQHTSFLTALVWMDPKLVKFNLHPGHEVPGGQLTEPDHLQGDELKNVLAAFNSGFQMVDSHGGFWQNGVTTKALTTGAASMVFTKDGGLNVEAWPGGSPSGNMVGVRQNLQLLVDNGQVTQSVIRGDRHIWGGTVGNKAFVWRSAVGVRADGTVLFAAGDALSSQGIASVMQRAGAVRAMELDINPEWANYITYSHSGSQTTPHKLVGSSIPNPYRYQNPSSRDFVSVVPRYTK